MINIIIPPRGNATPEYVANGKTFMSAGSFGLKTGTSLMGNFKLATGDLPLNPVGASPGMSSMYFPYEINNLPFEPLFVVISSQSTGGYLVDGNGLRLYTTNTAFKDKTMPNFNVHASFSTVDNDGSLETYLDETSFQQNGVTGKLRVASKGDMRDNAHTIRFTYIVGGIA